MDLNQKTLEKDVLIKGQLLQFITQFQESKISKESSEALLIFHGVKKWI